MPRRSLRWLLAAPAADHVADAELLGRFTVLVLTTPANVWLKLVSGLCGVRIDVRCEDNPHQRKEAE